jgi:hypothetical protein
MHDTSKEPGLDIAFCTNPEASNTEPHELGIDEFVEPAKSRKATPEVLHSLPATPAVTTTHVKASL